MKNIAEHNIPWINFGEEWPSDPTIFFSQRRDILFSRILIFSIVVALFLLVKDLVVIGIAASVAIDLLVLGIIASSLWLAKRERQKFAKCLFLFLINLIIAFYTSVVPFDRGIFLYFFPLIILPFVIFDDVDLNFKIVFIAIPSILFLALAITDFNLLGNYKIPTSSFGRKNFIINATITALMISFFIEFMQRANRKSEKLLLKLTDELNVKKDDLEKTNKELDRFVYSASHDLRAPLASIQGLANIASVETDLNRNKEYISMIGDRARKLDFFIQEIIDYSRNARTELHLELTDIKALSLEVIENLRFFDHAEEVKFFIDENQLDSTMLDKSRMKIVLNNILSNAIKYHNPKIQHKEVNLKIHHEDKVCVVTIADNGLGIQSEFLDKIFDMFYRATDKSTGSGLGLYIVKEIIIKMGGTIDVQSQFEKGTTFTIKLPIR